MKILLLDLETSPFLGFTWGKYEQNVIKFTQDSQVLSFAWKWLHEKQVYCMAQCDYAGYRKGKLDDKKLVKDLWDILDKADAVIAHNGIRFDEKVANARFVFHKMIPPKPFKSIDTRRIAKATGMFPSNKLDDLAQYFGVGKKMSTGGFELWEGCMAGDKEAWKKMKSYNKHDVVILEPVYLRLLPWIKNHPNRNLYDGTIMNCPNCGSDKVHKRGTARLRVGTRQLYRCGNCGATSQGKIMQSDVILR